MAGKQQKLPGTAATESTTDTPTEDVPPKPASKKRSSSGKMSDKLYYRIGEVAQLVGVDAHVLRYWESEFKLKPHRSNSGQRLYRKPDLSAFLRIKNLLHEEGYTISGARKALSKQGSNAPKTADNNRFRDALDRVNSLRYAIQDFQDEIAP